MPLFMDVHSLGDGVTMDDVAKAHQADLATQGPHGVNHLRYWSTRTRGRSSASSRPQTPTPRTPSTGRLTALVADSIFEVQEGA